MRLFFWSIYWVISYKLLRPIRAWRRSKRIELKLAGWLRRKKLYRLLWLLTKWWEIRNFFRFHPWWIALESWWFERVIFPLLPKCKRCGGVIVEWVCFACFMESAHRKSKLDMLTEGRRRYGNQE